jgi:hypothetical protein
MGAVLGFVAIAILLALMFASARMQRGARAAEKEQADARAQIGQEQHENSLRRRAEVRAAPVEQAAALRSPGDE